MPDIEVGFLELLEDSASTSLSEDVGGLMEGPRDVIGDYTNRVINWVESLQG